MFSRVRSNCLLAAIAAFAVGARSQCATQWSRGPHLAGCDGGVNAVTEWDPDGVGPRAPVVVLGGGFTTAGDVPANRVVVFDPSTAGWSPLGSGITGSSGPLQTRVFALAVLSNGDLVAGGAFTTAGGAPASRIARWDGTAWSPLGSGMDGDVRALCVLPNGDLVAGGYFTSAGGVPAQRIARWNGLAWSALGAGLGTGSSNGVVALTVQPNGELIAAGHFTPPGGPAANPIARWTGTAWSAVGAGITGTPTTLAVLPNGDLLAGGGLVLGGGSGHGVLRWNGSVWSPFGSTLPSVTALCRLANGEVVAVGASGIFRGTGGAWVTIGTPAGGYGHAAAQLGSGAVVVGGSLDAIDGIRMFDVGVWNGSNWSQLGAPAGLGTTSAATCLPSGEVVVAENTYFDGATRVHLRTGSTWSQLGGDFDSYVHGLGTAANGDVLACGEFTAIGGVPTARVARWNGSTWQPLGSGMDSRVNALRELANGDLVATGAFASAGGAPANCIARWDGSTWSPLAGGLPFEAFGVIEAANGDLLVGIGGSPGLMRWNGAVWTAASAVSGVTSLAELPNGDIVAGGSMMSSLGWGMGHIGRWDGSAWHALGNGLSLGFSYFPGVTAVQVAGLAALPDGDVVAVGTFAFAGGLPALGAARWDGTSWTPLATMASGFPQSLARAPNGDLVLSGVTRMDDAISAGFARLTTTCPATATTTGPGCAGNTLAPTTLPWTGSVFAARASGLPAAAIALDVLGFTTTSLPLTVVLSQAGTGCALAVDPGVVLTLLPAGGIATTQLQIPNSVTFAGAVVHEQVLALGLGAGGAITTFTGTNRLTLTIGVF